MQPYLEIDGITLYHGNCLEVTEWLMADVLVTDPPYGRNWRQGRTRNNGRHADDSHAGIAGDDSTTVRDQALCLWGKRPAVAFGDLMLTPPWAQNRFSDIRSPTMPAAMGPWVDTVATLRRSTSLESGQAVSVAAAA